ncbi:MAG: hypothetical protein PSU94_03275 [Lacunisphaera sp.]|nr:hypothetical protein [Lacunisphaera sp.]
MKSTISLPVALFAQPAAPVGRRFASLFTLLPLRATVLALLTLGAGADQALAKAPKSAGDDGVAIYQSIVRDEPTAPEWNGRGAPRWIRFTRERVKAGGLAGLFKSHAVRSTVLTEGQWPRNTVTLRPLSGPQEIWSFTGYNETYAWGDEDPALLDRAPALKARLEQIEQDDAAFTTEKRDLVLRYKPDLSYQPDFDWSEVRVFSFTVRKIRKADEEKFKEWCRKVSARHAQFNIPEHLLIYSTASGDTDKVYFQISPFRSVRDFDLVSNSHPASKDSQELFDLMKAAVEWEESSIFYVDSAASHVTPEFATPNFARAIDPYWGVNPSAIVSTPDGVKEPVALDKLPAAVRDAVKQTVGTGRLLKVVQTTRNGSSQYAAHYWEKPKYFADGRPAIYKVPDVTKKAITVEELPAVVQPLVKAEIDVCMKYELNLREGKDPQYELVLVIPGRSNLVGGALIKDVIYDATGKILAVEAQVALEDVPEVPRALFKQAIVGGQLLNVQQLTKDGTIIYEGRIGKIQNFTSDGRLISADADAK